jgi:hypothetical protein
MYRVNYIRPEVIARIGHDLPRVVTDLQPPKGPRSRVGPDVIAKLIHESHMALNLRSIKRGDNKEKIKKTVGSYARKLW